MLSWLKRMFAPVTPQAVSSSGLVWLPDSNLDFRREAGDLTTNAVVAICIAFLARKALEARLELQQYTDDGWVDFGGDPVRLLEMPNPDYDYSTLLYGVITSYVVAGNAYLYKAREGRRVAALYYVPHWQVTPQYGGNSARAITAYDVTTQRGILRVPKSEMLHLRHGMQISAPAMGVSPLAAVLKEVTVDNWAASYSASMLNNLGVGSYLISPRIGENVQMPTREQMEQIRERFASIRREGVGRPIIFPMPVGLDRLDLTPEDMALDTVIRQPVSRICAALGLDSMALGLPSSSKTYNNYAESLQSALENGVVPLLTSLGRQFSAGLLHDEGYGHEYRLAYDYSQMRGLQDDVDKLHQRVRSDWQAELIDRATAKTMLGYPVEQMDEGLYLTDARGFGRVPRL